MKKGRNAGWKNFKQNTGKTQRATDVFSIFTRILIIVQVLASSQREPIPRETPGTATGRSQLLAQPQALRGYVVVTVIYQNSPSALLSSKRAADRHVCGDDNRHTEGLDINRFKAPLRPTKVPLHLFYSSVAQICGYVELCVRTKLFLLN